MGKERKNQDAAAWDGWGPTPGALKRADKLVRLAEKEFGALKRGEEGGEEEMLRAAAEGRNANLLNAEERALPPGEEHDKQILRWERLPKTPEGDRPWGGSEWGCWKDWGEHRRVRGEVLAWVCASPKAHRLVHPTGIQLAHALFEGPVRLEGARVPFDLVLGQCAFEQEFLLLGASLTTLSLHGCWCNTISGDGLETKGAIFLRNGFRSRGQVRLLGASIGSDLDCYGADLDRARNTQGTPVGDPYTLNADGLETKGAVFLRSGFRSRGRVSLIGASVGGILVCSEGSFEPADPAQADARGVAMDLDDATIRGRFELRKVTKAQGRFDLSRSHIGYLDDEHGAWPEEVLLDSCTYDAIAWDGKFTVEQRLEWLKSGDTDPLRFNPQPYRQLASVLRKQGHDGDANKIMRAAMRRRAKAAWKRRLSGEGRSRAAVIRALAAALWGRGWSAFFGAVAGYGYARWRPLWYMLGLIVIGWAVFSGVVSEDASTWMQPTQGLAARSVEADPHANWVLEEYPDFHPLAYSMDTFLPLVNLHQETYWTPRTWWVKRVYLPVHILMGWVITTLFAVSFTGLVRQDKPE